MAMSPSLSGLDDRDKRLVRAYVALWPIWELAEHAQIATVPGDVRAIRVTVSYLYTTMSAHARRRCQQWLRRYAAAQAKGESDA